MSVMFKNPEARAAMEAAYARLLASTAYPDAESRTVSTRFGDTHVLVAGPKDAPPLVVLHGALACSALTIRESGGLVERFRVYAVDVVGQSVKSADARLKVDSDDYGAWAKEVLDGLGLERPHLYGASYGGFISRKLIEIAPERIDRLVLLVPAGVVGGKVWEGLTKAGIPLLFYKLFGSKGSLEDLLDGLMTTPDEELREYLRAAFTHYNLDMTIPPLAKPERLANFKRPTLVLAASDDVSFPGAPLLARMKELVPHAKLEMLENTKHIPATDETSRKKLAKTIASFLGEEHATRQPQAAAG